MNSYIIKIKKNKKMNNEDEDYLFIDEDESTEGRLKKPTPAPTQAPTQAPTTAPTTAEVIDKKTDIIKKNIEEYILTNGLIEKYDINKVFLLLNNDNLGKLISKRHLKKEVLQKEINKYTEFLQRIILNNGEIKTHYFYNNDKIKLRKFTKTTSTQNIIRELRNFLISDYKDYKDIDFINCISGVMIYITDILHLKNDFIKKYFNEREQLIKKYYGKKEEIKAFIMNAFFNSNPQTKPKGKNEFEKGILKEIKEIHNNLNPQYLENTNKEFLKILLLCRDEAKKSEQKEKNKIKNNNDILPDNLEGKILCNLYHYYENKALMILTEYLYKTYKKYPHSLIFDGLIFNEKDISTTDINNYFDCLSVNKEYYFMKFLKIDIKPFKMDEEILNALNAPKIKSEDILTYQQNILKSNTKTSNLYNVLNDNYKFKKTENLKIINGLLDFKKESIKKYNEYTVNLKNGFITNDKTKQTENLLLKLYEAKEKEEDILTIEYNKPEEIRNEAIKFINNKEEKLFIVKAACGTGKTHIIINEVLKEFNHKKHKVLYLTENNILNIKFTTEHDNFISHTDKEKDLIDYNFNSCSIQSIIKVINKTYDLVIIDEIDSVLNSIKENITFKNSSSSYDCFKILCYLMNKATKILILDQDIEGRKINLIENILNINNNSSIIHKLKLNAFNDVENIFYTDKRDYEEKIINELKQHKKISVATASKTYGDLLTIKILTHKDLKNKNLLFLHADDTKDDGKTDIYIKNEYVKNDIVKTEILENLTIKEEHKNLNIDVLFLIYMSEIIEFYKIDIFIFTPSLKTGTSLNNPYFNKIFCYTDRRSIIPKQMIQMILRSRQIIDKQIIFYTPLNYYNKIILNNYDEETEKFNIKEYDLINELKKTTEELNITLNFNEINKNYETLQGIINYEDYIKNNFYIYELINTLIKNGYKKPIFKYVELNQQKEEKEEVKETKEDKLKIWLSYKLIYDTLTVEGFNELKNKKYLTETEKQTLNKNAFILSFLDLKNFTKEEDIKKYVLKANNKDFYNKFLDKRAIEKIKFIKEIIKYQQYNKETKEDKLNKLYDNQNKKKIIDTIKLLEILKVNLNNFKNVNITNKDFKLLFNIKTTDEFKNIYKTVKSTFKELDLKLSYTDKNNTTGETSKIHIKQRAEKEEEEINDFKNIHFYYLTNEEEEEEEKDTEKKKWMEKIENGTDTEKYKIVNKDNKYYFNKRIRTKDEKGKNQDRILKFEIYKKDDGNYTVKKPLKEYNKEKIELLTYNFINSHEEEQYLFIDEDNKQEENISTAGVMGI